MLMKIKIIEPAELELEDAFNYYENELIGLGTKFIQSFRNATKRILNFPLAWAAVLDDIRKCNLEKFPYTIIYAIENDTIIILAISHHHRKPFYWIDRYSKIN